MLEYFCSRLEGLSVGHFRLEVQNQQSNISPQSIIRVTLPSNALVEVPSLAFHFNAQCDGATATASTRLPNGIDQLINRCEVSIGGVSVASGANFYNVLSKAKDIIDGAELDAGMDHPEIITLGVDNNYVDGTDLTLDVDEAPTSDNNSAQFCISKWKGFLGSIEPPILSTDLVGDVVVSLFLEQANLAVMGITGTAGPPKSISDAQFVVAPTTALSYTLNNVYFTIKAYSMADGVLDRLYAEQMAQNEHLEVGFLQYFSYRDTSSGSTRFNVATQSLNRIIVAHHKNASPTGAARAPVLATGYNTVVTKKDGNRVLGLGKAKYIAPYTQFSEPAPAGGGKVLYEWQLNGAKYPMFRATAEDLLLIARQSGQKKHMHDPNMGLQQYLADNFVSCMKLTLDAPNARYIQGLDVRGTSLNGFYQMYNLAGTPTITIFLECSSSLFISPGRQVAVVA